MKILYITQKLNYQDDLLGAIHSYIAALASRVEKVYVVCLFLGENRLPENCEVFSLGKERGTSDFGYLVNFYRFVLPLIFKKKINGIFIHMNEIYVYLLLPFKFLLKLKRIPVVWWKAHAVLGFNSRLARHFVDRIATSVAAAFNIKTPKRRIIGQGIDTNKFKPLPEFRVKGDDLKIISIGRLSPVRNYPLLLQAVRQLLDDCPQLKLKVTVYGQIPFSGQQDYFASLENLLNQLNLKEIVVFAGAVPNPDLPKLINQADFVVNPGGSNSLDKSIVETMACEKIIIDSNAATREILANSSLKAADQDLFLFKRGDVADLLAKIKNVINLDFQAKEAIEKKLRSLVVEFHDVNHLSEEIIKIFKDAT